MSDRSSAPVPKCTKHHDSFDPKWKDEFTWLIYILFEHADGPSMLYSLCHKHNELLENGLSYHSLQVSAYLKGKIREHMQSHSHADAVNAEGIAAAAQCSGGICASLGGTTVTTAAGCCCIQLNIIIYNREGVAGGGA